MNQNQNPFFVIHQELLEQRALIEKIIHNQKTNEVSDLDKYEQGVKVAMEELNWKQATIYCNIDKLPHRKLHGKLYFNRTELQNYIRSEGLKK